MSKPYQNYREIQEALLSGKKICRQLHPAFYFLNKSGHLVNDWGMLVDLSFIKFEEWQEYIEPVTLEMAIAHYKATGKPFMRRAHPEDSWGVGEFVFHEADITATDYVLLTKWSFK